MGIIIFLFSYLLFTSIFNTHVKALAPEVDDESLYSYEVGSRNGPENWANVNKTWRLCGTGQKQSPIDITDAALQQVLPSLGSFTRFYNLNHSTATIRNRGHDIQVQWRGNAGGIVINGAQYRLQDCHWHIPSEHTVNGQRFSMELHLVHSNSEGDIAVVGVLYNLGLPDPFLQRLYPLLQSVPEEGTNVGILNPRIIQFNINDYYRYNGSLTTPPCSENVTWTVIKNVETVSSEQVRALMNAVHDASAGNARPIQPLNERPIYLYGPRRMDVDTY